MKQILLVFLFIFTFPVALAAPGDMTISSMAGPWPLTVRTCSWDAGAICSVTMER